MPKEKKTEKDLKEKKTKSLKKEKKELFAEYPNLWESRSQDDIDHTMAFAEEYMAFLNISKTEREFVNNAIEALTDKGFVDIDTKKALKPGDKVFASIKGKGLMFAVVGKEDIVKGMNILGAHIDSPRLDLKPNPLYEEDELVFFKTHYYGGIKKYQWTTIPLAIHGVIMKKDGTKLSLCIGEKDEDPIFCRTSVLNR